VTKYLPIFGAAAVAVVAAMAALASDAKPWDNPMLSPDRRATMVVKEMSEAEMLALVRGFRGIAYHPDYPEVFPGFPGYKFPGIVGSSGYIAGLPRLGIPALQETDSSLGVANLLGMIRPGDVSTALPSSMSLAASFDRNMAWRAGEVVGRETWQKGMNVLEGPGVNLIRDPRGGRNFEYLSEDPLLTGTLAAQFIKGVQSQHVLAVAKHFVMNDQETYRHSANAIIDEAAMRESDLLAFELAIESGAGAVMCSYNLVNAQYACENAHLLNDILKRDWKFPGFVMSDFGAVHGVNAARAGLDQESAAETDDSPYFEGPLKAAIRDDTVHRARLANMAHRILRSMFAAGLVDHPPVKSAIDYRSDAEMALKEEEEGIVLLKNDDYQLPLNRSISHIAVIGGHADAGVLSGGGSAQVWPVGNPAIIEPVGGSSNPFLQKLYAKVFDPSVPLDAIAKLAPKAEVRFDTGQDPSRAAMLARWADVVVVFATQWSTEGADQPSLALPQGQDQLIGAVASANPKTIVVLETGGPVEMPWLDKVAAVLEAWYPGQRGGEAIANVLFGKVNPSGHLPVTFPREIAQEPRPVLPGSEDVDDPAQTLHIGLIPNAKQIDVDYSEGASVGYRWFADRKLPPLFPFGFGLSYTQFSWSHFEVKGGHTLTVSFDVKNTGGVAGATTPQIYLQSRSGKPMMRLLNYSRMSLAPAEEQHVALSIDPRLLADFDSKANRWHVREGDYVVALARAATQPVLAGAVHIDDGTFEP